MAAANSITADGGTGRPLTGLKFLAILLGSFALVASVNGAMVYYALSTFSGEVDPHPYEHGLAYDKDIAAAEAQDARDWNVGAHIDGRGATRRVEATFHDRNNLAVAGLVVRARLEFATDMSHDRAVTLSETAPGIYRGAVAAASGQWDLVIEAKRATKLLFRSRNRITLP